MSSTAYDQLNTLLKSFKSQHLSSPEKCASYSNADKRRLYSDLEISILDWEVTHGLELFDLSKTADSDEVCKSLTTQVTDLRNLLKLSPIKRGHRWWYWLDIAFRFVGVQLTIVTISIYCALPIIMLQPVEDFLRIDIFHRLSVALRRACVSLILLTSGITTDYIDMKNEFFAGSNCSILTFFHSSNLDGFFVNVGVPIRHYGMGKKELFYVPFFSWISFAVGGIPVDRESRKRAINSLHRASEAAKDNKAVIAIAPEGTRSKSGNLQSFKKGTFHEQQQMQAPIIPFIIYGAWDLYPVGSWVNQCGHCVVKALPPIHTQQEVTEGNGTTKTVNLTPSEMLRLTRRKMLLALRETPLDAGRDLSYTQWIICYLANCSMFVAFYGIWLIYSHVAFTWLALDSMEALGYTVALVIAITVWLYLHFVYIADWWYEFTHSDKSKQH